jgi:hypothetical protein
MLSALQASAAEGIKGREVDICVCGPTEPAPLVIANVASHVIAARSLFNYNFTFRASLNVVSFCPLFDVLVLRFFAWLSDFIKYHLPFVNYLIAFSANCSLADFANTWFLRFIL